jgi:hypothetical protein
VLDDRIWSRCFDPAVSALLLYHSLPYYFGAFFSLLLLLFQSALPPELSHFLLSCFTFKNSQPVLPWFQSLDANEFPSLSINNPLPPFSISTMLPFLSLPSAIDFELRSTLNLAL